MTIKDDWQEFKDGVGVEDMTPVQLDGMHKCFIAGAGSVVSAVVNAFDEDGEFGARNALGEFMEEIGDIMESIIDEEEKTVAEPFSLSVLDSKEIRARMEDLMGYCEHPRHADLLGSIVVQFDDDGKPYFACTLEREKAAELLRVIADVVEKDAQESW